MPPEDRHHEHSYQLEYERDGMSYFECTCCGMHTRNAREAVESISESRRRRRRSPAPAIAQKTATVYATPIDRGNGINED